ncbi:GNAT family N-acetyltransferase [Planococcus soli]|uniref:GNAT family N-acetyltransferase n=1 Tax=Planococcus soli TaxID=2666072 RepID=UPI00115CB978|nr:GNAT family N-acetyltransferase [Planococcus soli]
MNPNEASERIQIHRITEPFEEQARAVVLKGLEERFGFIDPKYNPDLKSIVLSYSGQRAVFLVGIYKDRVICTGAVSMEALSVGRVERMSVLKEYRRTGVAKGMIHSLESWAKENGYQQLVLETNNDWQSSIDFYKNRRYSIYLNDGKCSHFVKELV